jgi:uncharacterized protein YciI
MSRFAVVREAGPGWAAGKGALEQPGVVDHSAFMDGLAEHGFLLLAGPLAGSEQDQIRALLVVEAAAEAEVQERLAQDPWARTEQLRTVRVESWNVFVGAERLAARAQAPLAYSSAEPGSNS